jgi:hypothetical protein
VISGVSASGKSTVTRLLAQRFERGVCVEGDVIREMVVSGRVEMRPEPAAEALRPLALRYAGALAVEGVFLGGGFDVVVEDVIIGSVLPEDGGSGDALGDEHELVTRPVRSFAYLQYLVALGGQA